MSDDYRDNYSSHSIDIVRRRPNKKLEIIIEESNSFNHDINNPDASESKTQANFYNNNSLQSNGTGKRCNSSEKKRRSKILHEKVKQILDYRAKINLMEPEDELEDKELKNEDGSPKKKVQKKVNKNLKLLNLIKERMNKAEKNEKNIEEKDKEVKNSEEKNEVIIEENKKEKEEKKNIDNNNEQKEENISVKNEKEEKKDLNNNNNNEDKKKKLLKLFDKKFNIINKETNEKKEKEDKQNEVKEEKEIKDVKEEKNDEEQNNKNIKNAIPHPRTIPASVSHPTFVKRGVGNFHINTPKSKSKQKNTKSQDSEKEKEEEKKDEQKEKEDKKNEEKSTEIPNEQKDKLTINITPNQNQNPFSGNNNKAESNNTSNKKENITINSNNDNNDNKIMNLTEIKKDTINAPIKDENILYITDKKENKTTSNNSTGNKNKNQSNNISNKNSSSKKGAMEILELLKAKKKEQNESALKEKNQIKKNSTIKKEEEDEEEKIIDNQKLKEIDSSYIFNQKKESDRKSSKHSEGKYDISSLPKKTFRDEEDEEENNFNDSHNKTQQQFRNAKKGNYYKVKNNENNRKRQYINNINNINNNINNFFNLNNPPNYQERKTINYINNANDLRNRHNRKMKVYNSLNQSGKNSPQHFYEPQNSMLKNNMKSLDNSFDNAHLRKNNMGKKIYNKNYNSINVNPNNNIYEPKKISNNNSPMRFNPIERNPINDLNSIQNNRNARVYNKINNKRGPAYVKKSPGRFKDLNNSNYNYNNKGNNNKVVRNMYNIKNNNNNNIFKNPVNNYMNTNINSSNNNIGGFDISSIYGLNSSTDTYSTNRYDYINTNYNNNFYNTNNNIKDNQMINNQKANSMLFNLEDLMVLEERLNDITFSLESNKNIERQCFNFWNYYYNCSLYQILEKIFPNEEDSNLIRLSINYELMSIMICYEFSFEIDLIDEDLSLTLLELIYFNHDNLMIICEYILTKIAPENKGNLWALKLQEIVNNAKMSQMREVKNNYLLPINKINNNTNKLIQKIRNIFLNYKTQNSNILKNFFLNIESKTYDEINDFFRDNILRENNFEGSIVASSYLKKNKYFKSFAAPYITEPSTKPYTLILDLDETLVNFKIKSSKEGTLRARPFLFGFLEEMGHYYELIVWTSATEAYANSLIDAIEFEKKYFDYVLFREHAIIIGDDFVKDLNRVGRSLDRVIIVDDMPQNFRLQKQNGITIKPFLGDDYNDTALYDLLPILKHIAEEGNDVRIGLEKYRDEIVKKITSNISKNNI